MTTAELLNSIEDQYRAQIELIKSKGADYAQPDSDTISNFRNSQVVGVSLEKGILVRVMDKISRISILLCKEPHVKDESIKDSLRDARNYLHILEAVVEENGKNPPTQLPF